MAAWVWRLPCGGCRVQAVATLPNPAADRAVLVVGVTEEVLTEGGPGERSGGRIVGRLTVRVVEPLGQHEASVPMLRYVEICGEHGRCCRLA